MSYTTYAFNEPDICTPRFHIRFLLMVWQLRSFTVRLRHSKYREFGYINAHVYCPSSKAQTYFYKKGPDGQGIKPVACNETDDSTTCLNNHIKII